MLEEGTRTWPVSGEDCKVEKIEVEGRHENAVMMIPYSCICRRWVLYAIQPGIGGKF